MGAPPLREMSLRRALNMVYARLVRYAPLKDRQELDSYLAKTPEEWRAEREEERRRGIALLMRQGVMEVG